VELGINEIREITKVMAAYPDMNYTNYSLSFLRRRLSKVFKQSSLRRLDLLQEKLKDVNFRDEIMSEIMVNTTEMFRDPALWRTLRDKVITNMPVGSDKIWFPVESDGEETFSLALVLHEKGLGDKYKIICQTPSRLRFENISKGVVNQDMFETNLTNYKRLEDKNCYADYFEKDNGKTVLLEQYRSNIECRLSCYFSQAMPENSVALIMFRNISIYYNHLLARKAFRILINSLIPGGYLIIGVKERLPKELADELEVVDANENIYRKPASNNYSYYV
jgi:chemotaxis protein methyltransferase CheR